MDYQLINNLLEKYFEGETNLQEEKQLKHFFTQEAVPEEFSSYQPLFQYFEQEAQPELDAGFEEKVLRAIEKTDARVVPMRRISMVRWMSRAAAVIALVALGWWASDQITTPAPVTAGIDWSKYEVQDPEEAFKFTQVAFLKASSELNRGTNTAAREVGNLKTLNRFLLK
jgi:hypothetical protein